MKKTLLCLGSVFLVSGITKAQKNVIKTNDSIKQGRLMK
jgi:iron complex outermembrane receptor protein